MNERLEEITESAEAALAEIRVRAWHEPSAPLFTVLNIIGALAAPEETEADAVLAFANEIRAAQGQPPAVALEHIAPAASPEETK